MTLGIFAKFLRLAPISQIHKNKYKLTLIWTSDFSMVSFDVKCGVKHYEWLSLYWYPWFGVFRSNFPNLPQFPNYTKTGLTPPADGLYTWIMLCLMWNVEFYTLNDFLCIHAHDLGYLCLLFRTCPNSQSRYKLTLRWPLHLSKASFDVKCGF